MLTRHKLGEEVWIDINKGTASEIKEVMDEFSIHPFVAKELTSKTPRPRIEIHNGYIYCIMHFPAWKHTHTESSNQEIDFVIGKNVLITARYDTIDAFHKFGKALEVREILDKENGRSEYEIFVKMLRSLYLSIFEELEYIEDYTESITNKIFKGHEKEMVATISEVSRTLLNFKKATDTHHEILESIKKNGKVMFGEKFEEKIESIILDYLKINSAIRSNMEMLHELRDTNHALLTSKQNETVKRLTVLGFIMLPLNLISWVFAMRTEGMPLIDNPNAFWIVIGMMFTSALITVTYARYKHWL